MKLSLNEDQKKLILAAISVGHYKFIGKNELSVLARNNGLPLSVVHSLTMNPSLACNESTMIHLPNSNGEFDNQAEYRHIDNKKSEFAKILTSPGRSEKTATLPEEEKKIFYQVDLDEPDETDPPEFVTTPKTKAILPMNTSETTISSSEHTISIPKSDPLFVPFGIYEDLETIIKSGIFHPVFITGLSGNGKTFSATEACAKLKRQCVRIPITVESDEDSLLGGFRLIDGNTVFQLGPIPEAMLAGAVAILDEVDKASSKIMCLQPVLEGQPIFLKRINRLIIPKKGFNIIATANTKGQGSEHGSFVTSLVLDEAFLERFAVTFEQDYPDAKTETKILKMLLSTFDGMEADNYIKLLIEWAGSIRKSYKDGAHNSVITTRRLTHIIKNYAIFGQEKHKAVEMAISRFDTETKTSFYSLWTAKCPVTSKSFGNTSASTTTTYANDKKSRPF